MVEKRTESGLRDHVSDALDFTEVHAQVRLSAVGLQRSSVRIRWRTRRRTIQGKSDVRNRRWYECKKFTTKCCELFILPHKLCTPLGFTVVVV